MSKIRVQLLDEKDVICDQFVVEINGRGSVEKIDQDLIDGLDWFNGGMRKILQEGIRTALEGRVAVLLKAKPN